MLMHVPAVLSATEVTAIRTRLLAADWVDGRQTVGAQGAAVKHNLQLDEASAVKHECGAAIAAALARSPLFHAAALPQRLLPPRFNLYRGGGEYGAHVDGSVMALQDGTQMRSDVSCTLFLEDPDAYDGGELVVSDTWGEHEVKLPAGDLVLYPSSSVHRVTPVTRGARLAAFFWVQSLVRDELRRRQLFELDTTIQRLTAQGAERDAVVRLTAVYHNLLRMWAET
ncbi:MAG TPA: Fe2+-dependent dioxygenase [Rhodanobacteraceae bacterium]|nr:Fe2+-dependent dioxygenase [Rhodanobacteraceae bacterium]